MRIIYHIRHRLTPRGGNQFYRDKRVREVATLCGAEPTEYDAGWREKAEEWTGCQNNANPGATFVPCEECKKKRSQ